MGREEKQEQKQKKETRKAKVSAEKKDVQAGKSKDEGSEPSDTTATGVKKAWSERLTWRRKKTTPAQEGEAQA
jgi:hypothetical protein